MMNEDNIFFKRLLSTEFVYHYTSIEALMSILEGYRGNRQVALPFRAGCVYNSNDPREMELGYKTVKEILPEYEKNSAKNIDLSEVFEDEQYENQCKECFFEKPKDGLVEVSSVPYAISFSSKRDFLPMWSMYGDNKKGVCLKFNLCSLVSNLRHLKGKTTQVCFVHYDGEENNIILDYLLPVLYDFGNKSIEDTHKMSIAKKIENLSMLCECISPFVKSNDWAYESEFRLVNHKHYGPVYNEFGNTLNTLKVERHIIIPIVANSLEEIITGPLANDVWTHILLNEFKECGLSNVDISSSNIKITK